MGKDNNIQQKVAQTILQQPLEIIVGTRTYQVAPPSTATLIRVSQELAEFTPNMGIEKNDIISETLAIAKDCSQVGDMAAILILGAKGLTEKRRVSKRLFGFIEYDVQEVMVDKKSELAKELLEDLTPKDLAEVINKILVTSQASFFLGITHSLVEINLLQKR